MNMNELECEQSSVFLACPVAPKSLLFCVFVSLKMHHRVLVCSLCYFAIKTIVFHLCEKALTWNCYFNFLSHKEVDELLTFWYFLCHFFVFNDFHEDVFPFLGTVYFHSVERVDKVFLVLFLQYCIIYWGWLLEIKCKMPMKSMVSKANP